MKITVGDLVGIDHIRVQKFDMMSETSFRGVSTDSRTVVDGDIFVALRGEKHDGHGYLSDVQARGASCAIVDAKFNSSGAGLPLVVVEDTVRALGQLARRYRDKFDIPVIAITGSSGKTSTKEMVAKILRTRKSVLATEGNLNNHIGVPATLFRLNRNHDAAVVEMGMNHKGEIAALCGIAAPTHGMITNIGKAHLGFFESTRQIARAKGELFEWLGENGSGIGFVNADDPNVLRESRMLKRRLLYGFKARRVDVRGKVEGLDDRGRVRFSFSRRESRRPVDVRMTVVGTRAAYNSLAAAAVGLEFDVPTSAIRKALESMKPVHDRMQVLQAGGVTILNDTYNANPDSVAAALETMKSMRADGKKIVILGDMLELGKFADEEHAKIGKMINRLGFDYVLTYGPLSTSVTSAVKAVVNFHYDQKNILSEYASELIAPGDLVLVKGSRGMKMEDVVAFLHERLKEQRR